VAFNNEQVTESHQLNKSAVHLPSRLPGLIRLMNFNRFGFKLDKKALKSEMQKKPESTALIHESKAKLSGYLKKYRITKLLFLNRF
jgi:hypothetical protein